MARARVSGGVARLTSPGAVRSGGYPGRSPGLRATVRATKSVALACLHNGIRALLSGRLHVWFAYCGVERHGSTFIVPFSLLDQPGAIPVPLNRPALTLGSGPRGVHDARRWVVRTCADIGRDDLVECAELGVSELVTNALLHGEPPIQVRVRGTAEHPRIEVRDSSLEAPDPAHGHRDGRARRAAPHLRPRASAWSRAAPTPGARRSRTTARSCGSRRPASSPRTTACPG